MRENVEGVLLEKLKVLFNRISLGDVVVKDSVFVTEISSIYSGNISVVQDDAGEYSYCNISLYRRSSGFLAHEIAVVSPIGSVDGLSTLRSSPYSRGILRLDVSVDSQRYTGIEDCDLYACISAIQRDEEKKAFITLLEKFGIF